MSPRALFILACVAFAPAGIASAEPSTDKTLSFVLAPQGGTDREGLEIARCQERAIKPSATAQDFERLGWAFIAKARRTLDAGYYTLAEKTTDVISARFGENPDVLLLRGHALHNLHRFNEAESIARRLVSSRDVAPDWALLSDVLMEQGKLSEAVDACQQFVNRKPGLEAYSRIAHLRWLKGDLDGAIDAMLAAVRSGGTGDSEAVAWSLSRLSYFVLQKSRAEDALKIAENALTRVPAYPPALLARGRALLALDRAADAVAPLREAAKANPLPEYQWWLADALRAAGSNETAAIEATLEKRGAVSDPRTTSLFLSTRGISPEIAVRLAEEELSARADVFTHDARSWALIRADRADDALAEIRAALAEGTQDARLFFHAGVIFAANSQQQEAQRNFACAEAMSATLTPGERRLLNEYRGRLAGASAGTP